MWKLLGLRELAKESRNEHKDLPNASLGVPLMLKSVINCEIRKRVENRVSNK
jgi:hypothetical protein